MIMISLHACTCILNNLFTSSKIQLCNEYFFMITIIIQIIVAGCSYMHISYYYAKYVTINYYNP